MQLPTNNLQDVLLACDPGEPLTPGDPRYMDFSLLRQGIGLASLQSELSAPVRGRFHHRVLCGHRGCGKSTELLALKHWADRQGFQAVHTEVDRHFAVTELEFTDLYLLAATVVEESMSGFGKPLPEEKIKRVVSWFAEVIKEEKHDVKSELAVEAEAQLGGKFPLGLGKLFAKFTAGMKGASSHAITTRQKIRNYPITLIDLTNDLLRAANESLGSDKPKGLLILFDNLDRYEPTVIDRALFRSSDLIRRIECNAVFAIPIALEYDPPAGAIQDCYGFSIVLPMLALRSKNDAWAADVAGSPFIPDAIENVRNALALRLDLEKLFDNPAHVDLLIRMSGGCIRDLMHLINLAYSHVIDSSRFTYEAVLCAIRDMRGTYLRRLNNDDYMRLAQIARRVNVPRDALTNRLLFNRFALEYLDEEQEPWMDVHPLVIETEPFRNAFASLSPLKHAKDVRETGRGSGS